MAVNALWKLDGKNKVDTESKFADVSADSKYFDAVHWAEVAGISGGYVNGFFGVEDPLTREQMMTLLWRYAKYKGLDVSVAEDTNILSYADALSISEYAIPAMQWACGAGLMQGDGINLTPQATAIRVQAAALFQRFCQLP